jgi:hypothetical protein
LQLFRDQVGHSSDRKENSMNRIRYAAALFILAAVPGAYLARAQQNAPQQPQHRMTFFVTSVPIGNGGNLGGVAGADAHCQMLAEAVGAGKQTWHAYLSTQAKDGQPAINARDRIGTGPWYNAKGDMIAHDLGDLHGDTIEQARLGSNLNKLTALTEKGEIVPGLDDNPDPKDRTWAYASTHPNSNRHEMLTGSQPDGRAYTDNVDHTCGNWTIGTGEIHAYYTGEPGAQIGFSDRNGGGNGNWNSSHPTMGCSQEALVRTHGVGQFYCFAPN